MQALRRKSFESPGHFENQGKGADSSRAPADARKPLADRALRIVTLLCAVIGKGGLLLGAIFELVLGRAPLKRSKGGHLHEEVEPFENPFQRKPF